MDCEQCYATALERIPSWKPHHSVYDIYSDVHHLSLYCVSNSCHYTHYSSHGLLRFTQDKTDKRAVRASNLNCAGVTGEPRRSSKTIPAGENQSLTDRASKSTTVF